MRSLEAICWPYLIIVGPDGRELLRLKGEHKEERVISFLYVSLKAIADGTQQVPWSQELLNRELLPIKLEKLK